MSNEIRASPRQESIIRRMLPLGEATELMNVHTPIGKFGQTPCEEPTAKCARTPEGAVSRPTSNQTPCTPNQSMPGFKQPRGTLPPSGPAMPFSVLKPYDMDKTCKAKVCKKYPLRHLNNGKKLVIEFVDEEGTEIHGIFWKDAAEQHDKKMKEGVVYILNKFQVKPTHNQFSTSKNVNELHFNSRSVVEECANQSGAGAMSIHVHTVPIAQLPDFIFKSPVDVIGVVIGFGSICTVKRKLDSQDVTKRDLTITDISDKTVQLTLWGNHALTSEGKVIAGSIMQVTACKVGDFNGCSLSTTSRSQITFDPSSPAAVRLSCWWRAKSQPAALSHEMLTKSAGASFGLQLGSSASGTPAPSPTHLPMMSKGASTGVKQQHKDAVTRSRTSLLPLAATPQHQSLIGFQSWGSGRIGGEAIQAQSDQDARTVAAERAMQRQQQFERSALGRAAYSAVKDAKNQKFMRGECGGLDLKDWLS